MDIMAMAGMGMVTVMVMGKRAVIMKRKSHRNQYLKECLNKLDPRKLLGIRKRRK